MVNGGQRGGCKNQAIKDYLSAEQPFCIFLCLVSRKYENALKLQNNLF